MKPGDIFVVDRGFRDVVEYLQSKGYLVFMPAMKGNSKQLTTEDANNSRFVTKVRWVVEAVHGILKQKYKLLDHILDNKILPKTKSYYRIASYLINRYGKRLTSDQGISENILKRMQEKKTAENILAKMVEENGWLRKKLPFENMSSDILMDFPELSVTHMKILFTGTYQLGQAISYL